MKKIIVLGFSVFSIIVIMSINGCLVADIITVTELSCDIFSATSKIGKIDTIYSIGENTVQLDTTVYQNRPGYLFTAFDSNNQELGKKFYPAGDKQGMARYKPFKKMSATEKKQFIKEDFLALGINLDPKPEIVTHKTAPTTPPDIPISSFAPAVTPASYPY